MHVCIARAKHSSNSINTFLLAVWLTGKECEQVGIWNNDFTLQAYINICK